MPIMGPKLDARVPPVSQLNPEAAQRLETDVRQLLVNHPKSNVDNLLEALKSATCYFCEGEQHEAPRRISKIKRELRPLHRHIEALLRLINLLSLEARAEFDHDIYPGFQLPEHFLALESPCSRTYRPMGNSDNKQQKKKTPRAHAPSPPPSTLYIDPVVVTLTRMKNAINDVLTDRFDPPENDGKQGKGGAPYRLPWHHLAWEVACAMKHHMGIRPSHYAGGTFEQLLRACLRAGLDTIGSKTRVSEDLRSYTRSAIKSLTHKKTA